MYNFIGAIMRRDLLLRADDQQLEALTFVAACHSGVEDWPLPLIPYISGGCAGRNNPDSRAVHIRIYE
ncbi:hypothetical protein [Sulfitobacter sp. SK012]|uniref:hypothetical protein n=1 Tax=Sulfitobacter sp. SK012 TaxID=1389005 RepID=UPI0013B3B5BE|nr:hypothetical protein [Sulfitobacter sp. SK012]